MQWVAADLHLHTPASSDYQQPETTNLDILQRAEARGLQIIAYTDHNTVAGYRRMMEEIQQLELLEKLKRIMPDEQSRLDQYRRLLDKILVLPGFEITATFGFHILGIFPPEKSSREIEHLLLDMNIPTDQLDEGSATVGATSDVLTIYRAIVDAGGLVIAAHANSSNGVAMRGFAFGGQTKIAYTQDKNLHALEVTDLDHKGPRATAAFFNGTKPEYSRRMHCIQGSDAHRLTMDPQRKKNLGVGDRVTDFSLPEVSFEALRELFESNDFARTRPHRQMAEPVFDFIRAAQEEGANIIQDFHESMTLRGGKRYAVIADVCALANTNGGTLYIGLTEDSKLPVVGVPEPELSMGQLEKEISSRISPPLPVTLDLHDSSGKKILRVLVPRGDDPPYAVDDNKIYVRAEAETALAVRDEIVELVMRKQRSLAGENQASQAPAGQPAAPARRAQARRGQGGAAPGQPPAPAIPAIDKPVAAEVYGDEAPRTGVEVVSVEERDGARYYTMRDLRNGNMVKNVTKSSARRLWHYAITAHAQLPADLGGVTWQGDFGLVRLQRQGKNVRYDLIQRTPAGMRYYFGVTEDGIHSAWKELVGQNEDE